MATKKQKREAAAAKRKQFLADVKASGLEAQRLDHKRQEEEMEGLLEYAGRMNARHNEILRNADLYK